MPIAAVLFTFILGIQQTFASVDSTLMPADCLFYVCTSIFSSIVGAFS